MMNFCIWLCIVSIRGRVLESVCMKIKSAETALATVYTVII